jgi:hypothetical protein
MVNQAFTATEEHNGKQRVRVAITDRMNVKAAPPATTAMPNPQQGVELAVGQQRATPALIITGATRGATVRWQTTPRDGHWTNLAGVATGEEEKG